MSSHQITGHASNYLVNYIRSRFIFHEYWPLIGPTLISFYIPKMDMSERERVRSSSNNNKVYATLEMIKRYPLKTNCP